MAPILRGNDRCNHFRPHRSPCLILPVTSQSGRSLCPGLFGNFDVVQDRYRPTQLRQSGGHALVLDHVRFPFQQGHAILHGYSCLASTTFAGQRQLFLRINDNYNLDEFPMA